MPIALITTIIAALPQITTGIGHLLDYIHTVRAASQQSGEWTEDLQSQFEAALLARARSNPYLQDKALT